MLMVASSTRDGLSHSPLVVNTEGVNYGCTVMMAQLLLPQRAALHSTLCANIFGRMATAHLYRLVTMTAFLIYLKGLTL